MVGTADGWTIRELCEHLASERGDQEFLVVEDPDTGEILTQSYAGFWGRAQQVANLFWQAGVRPGDQVVGYLYNSSEFVECLIGAASIGAILVPLNASYTEPEISFILQVCQVHLAVVDTELVPTIRAAGLADDQLIVVADEAPGRCYRELRGAQPATLLVRPEICSTDPVEIMFTSGTTSRPKGVVLTHHNFLFSGLFCNWQLAMRADDRYLTTMAVTHVNFQLSALMPVLTSGAVLVVEKRYSATRFWAQVRRHRASLVQGMAMMVHTLMRQPEVPGERDHQVREVHYFLPITDQEKADFEQRFGVRLLNNYGSTETLVGCITDLPFGQRRWPSIGRVGLGYQARVVDEAGREVPTGQIGEIMIRGEPGRTLMAGYWRDEQATAQTMDAEGWLHTADYGYVDANGWFYFVDRKIDLIKRAGENVSTTEVEDVLLQFPGVREAAVIGIPDPVRDEAVKAFIVPAEGAEVDVRELIDHCRARLAYFKVPSLVQIVADLPRGNYGKVQKNLLAKLKGTHMAINTDMVGQTFGPFDRPYTFRDHIIFALGCGAGYDGITDLQYVYEKDQKVLPMFAAMPIVESRVTKTIDYGYNYAGSLHWGFDVRFHQPLTKLEGTFRTMVRLEGLYDRGEGRGLLAQHIGDTYDLETNELLFTNESWDCLIYDGGWGGPTPPKDVVEMPDREADIEVTEQVPMNQALIYRLSGDYHPQHVDWAYAKENGQRRPILHAVSFAGIVCRHFINTFIPGEPERLTRFKTRITQSLLPGTTVVSQFWKIEEGRVHFALIDAYANTKPYLNWGVIEYR